ncbi:MAG: tetratricopeptide repeat protein [Prevotellaceae bacterium]|jgi:tetratricopeptide (TPR) repeat protein|nr:tetratricopeptide repeat protein [Prevotellaceae bacterium]
MKKIFLAAIFVAGFVVIQAQETQIRSNANHFFDEGKNLFMQQKYAVARVSLQKFTAEADKNLGIYAEAQYYIACAGYELKERDADDVLENFSANYPYFPMNYRVHFMLGRIYFEDGYYKKALDKYNALTVSDLNEVEQEVYYFTKGFCYLQPKDNKGKSQLTEQDYRAAKEYFKFVKHSKNYQIDGIYYSAYCNYALGDFEAAKTGFLDCKNTKYEEKADYHLLQIYEQTGNSAKAVEAGKRLLMKFPKGENNAEAYRILGEASFKEKNYDDAITYLKKYEQTSKKVSRNDMYMLGISLYYYQNYLESNTYLSKTTTQKDEMSQNAYLHIGLNYVNLNGNNKAKMAFQSAAAMNFDKKIREEALYNYAIATFDSGSVFGESVTAFNKFLDEFPKSAHKDEIYNLLATAYISDRNYAAALDAINTLKNPNKRLVQAKEYLLFQMGVSDFYAKNYSSAENYFSQSLFLFNSQSFSAQAYLWRGETFYKTGKYAKCRADLNAFLAQKQSKKQLEIDKANFTMAYSYFEENNFTQAQEWFDKFLNNTTDTKSAIYYDALNRSGDCFYYKRDFNSALQKYSKVIAANAKSVDYAIYQSGFIKGLQKNYSAKISDMEKVIKSYASSTYAPNAQYEIGRAYVLQNRYQKAIETYKIVMSKYPKKPVAQKAAVEIGMLYANMGETQKAIEAYKKVVQLYPGSEQTNVALEALQTLYVENNDVGSYMAYRQGLSGNIAAEVSVSQEDSLSFIAAEKIYAKGDYQRAISSLKNYVEKFCSMRTLNCITANYYLAESYYNTDNQPLALEKYDYLTKIEGNQYMEAALVRVADLAFTAKSYSKAAEYFEQLRSVTGSSDMKSAAQLGILRCYYALKDYEQVIDAASVILRNSGYDIAREREAHYCRAKALIALKDEAQAEDDLAILGADVTNEMGAEAEFLLAQIYFNQKKNQKAEAQITAFINKRTPFQYWVARSFVLLADIYVTINDDFQAKQYLLSLQENYKQNDDVPGMIAERLNEIEKREGERVY